MMKTETKVMHPDLSLPASRTESKILLFKVPILWHFVTAVLAGQHMRGDTYSCCLPNISGSSLGHTGGPLFPHPFKFRVTIGLAWPRHVG